MPDAPRDRTASLLSDFARRPVAPLPGAAVARTRGRRRAGRTRAALLTAGTAVAAGVLVLGVTVSGSGADTVAGPGGETSAPTTPGAPQPPRVPDFIDRILTEQDVSAVLGGPWTSVTGESAPAFTGLPQGCGAPAESDRTSVAVYQRFTGGSGASVSELVTSYGSSTLAQQSFRQLLLSLQTCGADGSPDRLTSVNPKDPRRYYGEHRGGGRVAPFVVQQVGKLLFALSSSRIDPDPRSLDLLVDRAFERSFDPMALDAKYRLAPLTAALLDGSAVSQVIGGDQISELDGYAVTPNGCKLQGGAPADTAQFPLGGVRVNRSWLPGGTQELIAYRTAADARQAYELLVAALRRCPADSAPTERIVTGLHGASASRTYLQAVDAEIIRPIAVEQVGRILSTISAPFVKDLDWPRRQTPLPALADAAAARVRASGVA